jgi:hypothetical protein
MRRSIELERHIGKGGCNPITKSGALILISDRRDSATKAQRRSIINGATGKGIDLPIMCFYVELKRIS